MIFFATMTPKLVSFRSNCKARHSCKSLAPTPAGSIDCTFLSTAAREKGLASPKEVFSEVTKAILKEKKAAQIIADNKAAASLEDLAAKNGLEVVNALAVNQKSGTLVGAGFEPYIVGAAFSLNEGGMSKLIKGNNGVYMLQLTAKKIAEDLEDYSTYARQLTNQGRERLGAAIVEALETSAEIENNRALYY